MICTATRRTTTSRISWNIPLEELLRESDLALYAFYYDSWALLQKGESQTEPCK